MHFSNSDWWRQCVNSFDFIATIFRRWVQTVCVQLTSCRHQQSQIQKDRNHIRPSLAPRCLCMPHPHVVFIERLLSCFGAQNHPFSPTSAWDDSQHHFHLSIWVSGYAYCSDWISVAEVSQSKGIGSILGSFGNSVASEIKVEDLSVKDAIVA